MGGAGGQVRGDHRAPQVDGVAAVRHDPGRLVKRRWATLGSDPLRINQVVRRDEGPVAWPLTMSGQVHRLVLREESGEGSGFAGCAQRKHPRPPLCGTPSLRRRDALKTPGFGAEPRMMLVL